MNTKKPQSPSYPVRLPAALRSSLQAKANELDRSLHWVIVKMLEEGASRTRPNDTPDRQSDVLAPSTAGL